MAIRPLTLQELAAAIGNQSSAFITIEQAVRDQIALCGSFLKVHGHEVALVHQSARDCLLREEPAGNPVLEEFRIKPEEAHLELARTCFDCIEHSALQHAPLDITDASCLPGSPLLLYAALHWPEHARCCSVGAHPPTLRVRRRVGLWDLFTRLYNGQTDWPTGCLVNKRAAYKFQAPIFTPGDYLQRTPFGAPKEGFGKTHKSRRRGYLIPK
jgi:hypothetical protein